jgi:hypothetical protein
LDVLLECLDSLFRNERSGLLDAALAHGIESARRDAPCECDQ